MMLNVFLKPHSNNVFRKNNIFRIDNGDNVFFDFDMKLLRRGIAINTLDLAPSSSGSPIVFCDMPYPWEVDYWKYLAGSKSRKVLFTFESPLVNPLSHIKFFHRFFDRVYSWNDRLVNGKNVEKFNLPVLDTNLALKEKPFEEKKLICMVNSNISTPYPLWLLSPYKKDLYATRLKLINFLEEKARSEFDLYGRGWNKPKKFSLYERVFGFKQLSSYKGAIPRDSSAKVRTISDYKFYLCLENCIADGYISEKIFDCFKAHTVPVYLGAPNITDYLPKESFIDFRDFDNPEALLSFLKSMSESEYGRYIERGKEVLESKEYRSNWSEASFVDTFVKAVTSF